MNILFTKSNSLMSRIIRAVTKEPVSHCAIEDGGFVIHSNLLGVHIESLEHFSKKCEIGYSVEASITIVQVRNSLAKYEGSGYDIGGLLYLGLRLVLPCLPKKNLWQSSGMFLCTEWVTEVLDGTADSLITPYGLYQRLIEQKEK